MNKLVSRVVVLFMIAFCAHADAISYQTGFIDGTVLTSTGAPVPGARIDAIPLNSSGAVSTSVRPDGTFHLEVPSGAYRVVARYEWNTVIGTETVDVADQATTHAAFTFHAGSLRLTVERDAQPVAAQVYINERGPNSCASATTCGWQDPSDPYRCWSCQAGDRWFGCAGEGNCQWNDARNFSAYGTADGHVEKLLPAGDYTVTTSSAWEPGQNTSFRIGESVAQVVDATTTDLGTIAYATAYVDGRITRNGQPYSHVVVQVLSQQGGGSVPSYDGNYSVRLPLGEYELSVRDPQTGRLMATTSVTLADAGLHTPANFDLIVEVPPEATFRGLVTRDGMPVSNASVTLQERPDYTCNDTCSWSDGQNCWSCRDANARTFHCNQSDCYFDDGRYYSTGTSSTGSWTVTVPPGRYLIAYGTAYEPGQGGGVTVGTVHVEAIAGSVVELGSINYNTGWISGVVTTCGGPSSGMQIIASGPNGGFSKWTQGAFSLRAPTGSYDLRAFWQSLELAHATAAVTAGGEVTFDVDSQNGQLIGQILRAGAPAPGSFASIRAKPPTCSMATECSYSDANDYCYSCTAGTRMFSCYGPNACYWHSGNNYTGYTDSTGKFRTELPAGDYIIDAYSAHVPGQSGQVLVGSVDASVAACTVSEVGTSGTLAQPGTNVAVPLSNGVTLTFSQVATGGEVSYVSTSTPQADAPPPDTKFLGLYYDFTVTAGFVGSVTMCLPYDPDQVRGSATSLAIYHFVDNRWVKLNTTADTTNHTVCASTTSFSWYVVGEVLSSPPRANAGSDLEVAVDATCHAAVPLDGSQSQATSGIASYHWTLEGASLGSGPTIATSLPPGSYTVQLSVTDTNGATSTDTAVISVIDRTPPVFSVSVSPAVLWPPDGKMRTIVPTLTATDNCGATPTIHLDSVTSSTSMASDISTLNNIISVRAARTGAEKAGRAYEVVYTATDDSGNATTATATVSVPFDQSKSK